jgi:hypothetical protein
MTTIISQKIVGQFVVDQSAPPPARPETIPPTRTALTRPEILTGATYKLKTPLSDHALYITINDIVIDGKTRPFEIFINSKAMDHFQWVVAMTRVISAVFRAGGEVEFLVEELRSVCDPKGGGYFKKGKYVNSLIAEIGDVLATHLQSIGVICDTQLSRSQKDLIDYAKAKNFSETQGREAKDDGFPENAVLCGKCNHRALVILDGCRTCLACGDSKCG